MTEAATLNDVSKQPDTSKFEAVFTKMGAEVSKTDSEGVKNIFAAVYATDEGQKAVDTLAGRGVKLSSRFSENKISHDDFGKYQPEKSYIGIGGILTETPKDASAILNKKINDAVVVSTDIAGDADKVFYFEQAVRRGDASEKFYDFADENNVPHIILSENVKAIEKRKNSVISEITVPNKTQDNADKLLLRKYEASQRDPALKPRYYRALYEYTGDNKAVQSLAKYETVRRPVEMQKAQKKESLQEKVFLAVRSWMGKASK